MIEALLRIVLVTVVAIPFLYLIYCLIAGRRLRIDGYALALNMAGAFLVMSVMEAGLGFLHAQVFGWRLWEYHLYPNHQAFGTFLGPLTWPWYGFHFYLFGEALKARGVVLNGTLRKGALTGLDGPLLEILGNGLYLLFFGQYVFYYFPPELGHLTSVFVMPHYALAGIVLVVVMRALRQADRYWGLPAALYFTGVCFVVVG